MVEETLKRGKNLLNLTYGSSFYYLDEVEFKIKHMIIGSGISVTNALAMQETVPFFETFAEASLYKKDIFMKRLAQIPTKEERLVKATEFYHNHGMLLTPSEQKKITEIVNNPADECSSLPAL